MFKLKNFVNFTCFFVGFCIIFQQTFNNFFFNNFFFNLVIFDTFSLLLIITTLFTLLICLSITDNKYFLKSRVLFILFMIFFITIIGLVCSDNIVSFFFFYELLLLPSFILVKESSPNRRSQIVANYFLLWTQLGSFLVLLGLFNFIVSSNCLLFSNAIYTQQTFLTKLLIFIGFGIKIPLWPFHFWLSKTHVEANTGFSIFLSGILVKAAVFGLYKFSAILVYSSSWFFLTIIFISVIDASLKMCVQVDLKKLVAFSTVQEMGLMTFLLVTPLTFNNQILFVFVIFHTFVSGLFFWIVDCVYRRFNTRLVCNINGLINLYPKLSFFIILSVYIFMGLPFTIKFSIEVWVFKNIMHYNIWLSLFMSFFVNYISIIFFFKSFLFINFGNTPKIIGLDLNKKELFIFILLIVSILILNFV